MQDSARLIWYSFYILMSYQFRLFDYLYIYSSPFFGWCYIVFDYLPDDNNVLFHYRFALMYDILFLFFLRHFIIYSTETLRIMGVKDANWSANWQQATNKKTLNERMEKANKLKNKILSKHTQSVFFSLK